VTDTIVLGLDGANWALLDPWLDDGTLPNLAALREAGVDRDLRSCLPPVTCPNWRCYSTGKNPGQLDVFWWEAIDTENRTLTTPTSRSFDSANLWDYLGDDGRTTGVMNLPMTYPPFDLDGWMVAGGPGSDQDAYTTPPELADDLDSRGYRLHPETPVTANDDTAAARALVDLIDDRLSTFRDLLKERPVDVAHLTVFYINVLQHFFYRGVPTRRAWEVIDEHIGAIRETYPDATLVLTSDHGCTEIDTVVYLNSWLEAEGYLVTEGDATDAFERLGINKARVSKLAHRFGVHDLVTRFAPEGVKQAVPEDEEGFKREQKLDRLDWERSRAVASGQGLVYALDDDPATVDALVADLEKLTGPNGRPIARAVHRREEYYEGPHVENAPHVVFDQRPGVHTSGAIGDNPPFTGPDAWAAENVATGLFLAAGPDVVDPAASETVPNPVSITDVMPTVLRSVDSPIPTDVDGTALDVFDTPITERDPIPHVATDARAEEDVQDRLADLGYLE
jgi:predicted AlkP superfamily phosphohydrolase/phosphomutase